MYTFVRFLILTLLIISGCGCYAQNYAVYNSYYNNPYLYNPAEAATDYTYLFLNQRQQWGSVEGAPVLSTVTFNTRLNESNAGIGIKASSYKRGLLTTTDVSLSYAYGVHLKKTNTLFFGLSGGAISNTIDTKNLKSTDLDDPAVLSYLSNNIQTTGNFGILYRSASGINFSATLPQLFAPIFNGASNFSSSKFSPVDNAIVSLYYKRLVEGGKIVSKTKKGMKRRVKTKDAYAPLEFYTMYKYSKWGNSQFEVLAKINVSQNFWLGGLYRQSYGFAGITGITIKRFILGYSYEPGGQPESGFSKGTHEIQLGLRLGNEKKPKRKEVPMLRSTIRTSNEEHVARFQESVEDTEGESKQTEKKKHYVVIKSYPDFDGADIYKKKLIEQKFNANIFYYEKDKKYYVYVFESDKAGEAANEARNIKNFTKLGNAKVLTVVVPK